MPVIHEDGNYLTEKGRALIAKLMASKSEIQFTRAAVGAGTIPEGMSPKDMTDLADWRADGLISDISTPVPGEAQLVFQVFSRDVPVGFLASEGAGPVTPMRGKFSTPTSFSPTAPSGFGRRTTRCRNSLSSPASTSWTP